MTDEPQQAMSSERLTEIRQRVEGIDEPVIYWNGMSGALEQAEEDRAALLAEVERRQAREAALLTVVQRVVDATEDWEREANHSWLYFDSAYAASDLQEQARALLASTERRSGGDGA